MFDPWNSTLEEAMAAQSINKDEYSPTSPIFQFSAAEKVKSLRERAENGDGFTILECVQQCVIRGLVAPEWLAFAFNNRYVSVLTCRAKSWDDPQSFGPPYPKGVNIKAMRKRRVLSMAVYNEVNKILGMEPDTPIDEALFERAGKKHNVGKTLASEYYYRTKKMINALNTSAN